ncbi:hypothetical protein OCAR_6071 [Afipia carboxidovorans OM5]|nr:hypothetical protein OCAR_6071 [Afipia carboxidovorans OM5]
MRALRREVLRCQRDLIENIAEMREIILPVLGQCNLAMRAMKQCAAEVILERLDAAADGGRRDEQLRRGVVETANASGGHECTQRIQRWQSRVHVIRPSRNKNSIER